ncbi:type VI secretion system protein TssA [Bryobacter aggregatus]|uniref:type VI secretion system protein TssA n=1 Tax=Bryobacter aggregatus TaxID=360054 RepID=UPI0004E25B19|nr:type VI secretion system protein TssA [Bryobacter aggregatus]
MPFREDILNPIAGENPGGADLRYDPVYDKIKEARREEEDIDQGDWKRERKIADWPLTHKLCEESIATRSKDLQLAAWLTEAAVRQRAFSGLIEGFSLIEALVRDFWDHLYPELEDDEAEFRATPLDWLANQAIKLSRDASLTKDGYSYLKYKESREVGYEDQINSDSARESRKTKLDEGKLAPETFDDSFAVTPKSFYVNLDATLNLVLTQTKSLSDLCDEKFGEFSPSYTRFRQAIEEIKQVTKVLLDKKRELEPDPISEEAAPTSESSEEAAVAGAAPVAASPGINISAFTGAEPPSRKALIESAVQVTAQLRALDPTNPGSYLMMRGLRFGELRAAAHKGEMRSLEAPPTEIRRQLRVYLLDSKWKELLDLTEAALALPASRAWMDLHRMTCEACIGLGDDYNGVATAIRGEVRTLVRDVPEIRNAILMDDTPACNPQTLAWIDDLTDDPPAIEENADSDSASPAPAQPSKSSPLPWRKKMADPFRVAVEALRRGDKAKALEIMRTEIETQSSARGKFLRQIQVAELCVQANQKEIAQPFLEDIKSKMSDFRVPEWEERSIIVQALVDLYLYHEDTIDSSSDRSRVFQQICRLDPVRALSLRS